MSENLDDRITAVFEERAENLSAEELREWSTDTQHDRDLLEALSGPGAKLLSGPRGCGKSTLLRRTYFELLTTRKALPAYVNYSKSLALEPLFHKSANAPMLFRQWVLAKIVIGIYAAFDQAQVEPPPTLSRIIDPARELVQELGAGGAPPEQRFKLAPSQLLEFLEEWPKHFGAKRTVLLLDDAAHAFSHEQQKDFFEIFRELRSRTVAAKAAVYPGVTRYSPHFHVGHEAQVLEAWIQPSGEAFLSTMRRVLFNRLPHEYADVLRQNTDICDYLALASFGIPRGFLLMISGVLGVDQDARHASRQKRMQWLPAKSAVQEHADSVRGIFRALSRKLPRFKNFVDVGSELERAALAQIRSYNSGQNESEKAVTFALQDPIPNEIDRVVGLLEYAGILRRKSTVSRGVKGVFHRFDVHYALLASENSLSLGRSYSASDVVRALESPLSKSFVRSTARGLLGDDALNRCRIDLQPCPNCNTPRASPDARFCINCGAELRAESVYISLLAAPIAELPITRNKIDGLKKAGMHSVQDILLDVDGRKLRSVPYVGEVWAARIRNAAEEFAGV